MNISRTIINRVVEEMIENAQDMGNLVLVPNTYVVFVHADDFKDIRGFLDILRQQIVEHLNNEITKRNRTDAGEKHKLFARFNKLFGLDATGEKKYLRVNERWEINFEECNGRIQLNDRVFELKRGEVGIVRNFAASLEQPLDSQFKTLVTICQRDESVNRTMLDGEKSTLRKSRAGNAAGHSTASHIATLVYQYRSAAETLTYYIEKPRTVIGRQVGDGVDLSLSGASERVSQKHLEITFDSSQSKFYLKSLGYFGVSVNGIDVPTVHPNRDESAYREEKESAEAFELTDGSRISVAGGEVLIDFYLGFRAQ